jgi:thiol:disulfide interchange protein DsbD
MKCFDNKLNVAAALLLAGAALLLPASPAHAHVLSAHSEHAKVTLLPQADALKPGQEATFGFLFQIQEHWHVYWKNPGDSGFAITIDWVLPEGYIAGDIVWPYPQRIEIDPLTSYGYEDELLLLSRLRVPDAAVAGTQVNLVADVKWLECRVECVPGTARFEFSMPVAQDPQADAFFQDQFEAHRDAYPSNGDGLGAEGFEDKETVVIRLKEKKVDTVSFFPFENGLIDNHATQVFEKDGSGSRLSIKKSAAAGDKFLEKIEGLLVVDRQGRPHPNAYEISLPLHESSAVDNLVLGRREHHPFMIVLFAFLGGLILNLMPCVLPVLSIKVLSLVESSHKGARSVLLDGLSFASGILVSFWFLAFFMVALRSAGHFVGWGFQFQSPVFVIFMAVLFFWLGMNLFGIFEVDLGSARIANAVRNSFFLKSPFLNGVLATVVATPCTAPFMGTALGYALSQPAAVTFAVFTSLGLGLACPYIVLSLRPQWLRFIPKPGPWMITMKKAFGLMFMASVWWLAWVLFVQRGATAVAFLLAGLSVITLSAWTIGKFAAAGRNEALRRRARLVAVVLFLAGFGLALYGSTKQPDAPSRSPEEGAIGWEAFSPERLSQLREEGKAVFIDFTATWCLTCQVNERVAIDHPMIVRLIKEKGIVMMKADWTNYDAVITRALESYGKNSIPVYVIYAPGARAPVFLPEILTPGIVEKALKGI